jgi:hypothetical protein
MGGYQKRAFRGLRKSGLGDVLYAPVGFSVVGEGSHDDEPTRRTRGLVFLGIGAAAALQHRATRLIVAENGIGALNLPFTGAQSGAMTSRAVHPKTLDLMAQLVGALTDADFVIENPFISMTKGEMVRALPEAAYETCAASESCDNAASGRGSLERRCGHCTSCLLRRVSFHAAGRDSWDVGTYLSDVMIREGRWRMPEMLWQAAGFDRALRSSDPNALLEHVPDLTHIPYGALNLSAQRRLLSTYVEEWRHFPHPDVRRYLDSRPIADLAS